MFKFLNEFYGLRFIDRASSSSISTRRKLFMMYVFTLHMANALFNFNSNFKF